MAENSAIEWTEHTYNPWRGCQKVSPGCFNCYAETLSARNPATLGEWGPPHATERVIAAESYWRKPLAWNANARAAGVPARVFVASLADVFEDAPQVVDARARLFDLVEATPWLVWLLLTKRPANVAGMVPWGDQWPTNVWLGTSVEDQQRADERIPQLLALPAAVRFLSCEPLLGPVDLGMGVDHTGHEQDHITTDVYPQCLDCSTEDEAADWTRPDGPTIDWVIAGGESGPGARPMHPDWARSLRDQCAAAQVPFLFKQWGAWVPHDRTVRVGSAPSVKVAADGTVSDDGLEMRRVGKKVSGRLLDGTTHGGTPPLAVPAVT